MLTWGDEYPIHQTPEPVWVAGSDRNFYDRYFFNGYSRDGSVFFGAAFGVYPHLNVMDGAFSVLKDGVQRSVHVSRIMNHERMDTRVGPMRIDVLQPLQSVKITLDNAEGISGELTFTGRHFPVEEPRFQRRNGSRTVMDVTRMTQNGHWSGWIEIDGERIEVDEFYGTRDRSWGVRPIGSQDPQPVVPEKPYQFYWVWTPLNFENLALYFHVNEDEHGKSWNTRSVLGMDGADAQGLQHLEEPKFTCEYEAGTRRISKGLLEVKDTQDRLHKVHYEPIATFQMKGLGYGHPDWAHGVYKGAFAIEREDFKPGVLAWNEPTNLHIQAISKVTHEGPDGKSSEGIGALEQLFIGPHAPSGWSGLLDA
ncbi:hypothetical protein [Henriciella marina]|uniref:hypothetical protein n=1 Tax=Henriciella marina TaxID=453851 RepID=UPI000373D1C0|nr:hypothetical protein [Henriciella marina]